MHRDGVRAVHETVTSRGITHALHFEHQMSMAFIRTLCDEWVEVRPDYRGQAQPGELTNLQVDCMACIAAGGSQ